MSGSIPLGWLQLKAQKLRLVAAITGITFAVILIFVQLEFREALFVSAVRYHDALNYDLAMLSPKTDFMVSSKQFPRARLYQTLGVEGVQSVTAVYMRLVSWRNTTRYDKPIAAPGATWRRARSGTDDTLIVPPPGSGTPTRGRRRVGPPR